MTPKGLVECVLSLQLLYVCGVGAYRTRRDQSTMMKSTPDGICTYQLPAKFNIGLVDSVYGMEEPEPKLLSSPDPLMQGVHDTNQFCLERIFFSRMQMLTNTWRHPSQCKLFYIPYFTAWETWGGGHWKERDTPELDNEVLQSLVHMGRNLGPLGHDHFIVSSRVYVDTQLFAHSTLKHVIKLTIERWSPDGLPGNVVGVPYTGSFRFIPALEHSLRGSHETGPCWLWSSCLKSLGKNRTGPLVGFVGSARLGKEVQRYEVMRMCRERPKECLLHDTGDREYSSDHRASINEIAHRVYSSSVFCLHPPGDTPTRKGIFDSLLAGCIPVVFDAVTMQGYQWHLEDWKNMVVHYPLELGPSQPNVIDVMLNFEVQYHDSIQDMQRKIADTAYSLQYSTYTVPGRADAFDVTLARMMSSRHDVVSLMPLSTALAATVEAWSNSPRRHHHNETRQ